MIDWTCQRSTAPPQDETATLSPLLVAGQKYGAECPRLSPSAHGPLSRVARGVDGVIMERQYARFGRDAVPIDVPEYAESMRGTSLGATGPHARNGRYGALCIDAHWSSRMVSEAPNANSERRPKVKHSTWRQCSEGFVEPAVGIPAPVEPRRAGRWGRVNLRTFRGFAMTALSRRLLDLSKRSCDGGGACLLVRAAELSERDSASFEGVVIAGCDRGGALDDGRCDRVVTGGVTASFDA